MRVQWRARFDVLRRSLLGAPSAAARVGGALLAGKSGRPPERTRSKPAARRRRQRVRAEATAESASTAFWQLQASFSSGVLDRPRFTTGAVAGPGAHGELAVSSRPGGHANAQEGAGPRRTAGKISDGVLIANVVRDAFADGYHLFVLAREEGFAASYPGETAEHVRVPVGIRVVEDADGVYKGGGLFGHLQDLGLAVPAGVVAAIANHDQHFLFPASGLQMLSRLEDGVVKRRPARGRL